ncbi:MAG: MBL fold metallo-hydrolase [Chloroflexi bacterium]|nr:MBL fold metallo-hydrolase [Chloroflexota bacterium]
MYEIAPHVYLEDRYPGVVVGLLRLPHGTVLIDSPPCPDAARAWRTALRAFNGRGPDRVLVYLDYQADHCLGARGLSNTIVAHTYVGEMFQPRTNLFRGQTAGQGENWELCSNLQGMRWVAPNLLFDTALSFYWDHEPVTLRHRPGPTPGSIWVQWATPQVIFVGDAVTQREPPFLADADLDAWRATLDALLAYDPGWTVVGSRDGVLSWEAVHGFRAWLDTLKARLHAAAEQGTEPPALAEALTQEWLPRWPASGTAQATLFRQRLEYGLRRLYERTFYHPRPRRRRRKRTT